jgi:hypothetical protein
MRLFSFAVEDIRVDTQLLDQAKAAWYFDEATFCFCGRCEFGLLVRK